MKHYKIKPSITDRSETSTNLYLKEISKYPIYTEQEISDLFDKLSPQNKEVEEKIIKGNLRFVVSIAKQYQNKGVPFQDLISVGNIGLMKAVLTYDKSFNVKFLSYAVWWIRKYILQELIENGKIIKIPASKIITLNKIHKFIEKYELENGIPPSIDMIKENVKDDIDVDFLLTNGTVSVVDDMNDDNESILDNILVDDTPLVDSRSITKDVDDILKQTLKSIEYNVICDMFGIGRLQIDPNVIAEKYHLTVERIRQIRDKAIIKLRKSDQFYKLKNLL